MSGEEIPGEYQQCDISSASTSAGSSPSATKKKKKKKKNNNRGESEQSASSPGGSDGLGGGGAAATTGAGKGAAAESLRPAAEPAAAEQEPLAEAPDLASLFSTSNLKKFKRKERADKEADAAEVWICVGLLRVGGHVCLCAVMIVPVV